MKDKNHVIVLIDAEKTFNKIKQLFMTKALNKLGREGNYINMMKPIAVFILSDKKLKAFPPKIRKKARVPSHCFYSTWF